MGLTKDVAVLTHEMKRTAAAIDRMGDKMVDLGGLQGQAARLEGEIKEVKSKVEPVPVLAAKLGHVEENATEAKDSLKSVKDKVEQLGHWKSYVLGATAVILVLGGLATSYVIATIKAAPGTMLSNVPVSPSAQVQQTPLPQLQPPAAVRPHRSEPATSAP